MIDACRTSASRPSTTVQPTARAARALGYQVVVATCVQQHGARIAGEGFQLVPIPPLRALKGPWGGVRALLTLAFAACTLATWLGFAPLTEALSEDSTHFETFAYSSQQTAHQRELAGVFMTGPQPGDKGIAVNADGNLRIFMVNAKSAPSSVQDAYRVGRIDGQLALAHSQPGGPILVATGNTSLSYCGETYTRLK